MWEGTLEGGKEVKSIEKGQIESKCKKCLHKCKCINELQAQNSPNSRDLKTASPGERKMGVKALCTKGKQNVAILSCQPVQPTSQSAKAEL